MCQKLTKSTCLNGDIPKENPLLIAIIKFYKSASSCLTQQIWNLICLELWRVVGREGCSVGGVTVERAGWGVVSFPYPFALECGLEPKTGQNFESQIEGKYCPPPQVRQKLGNKI